MSAYAPAILATEGAVATISLNRPQALNAIDIAMAQQLAALADEVANTDAVRVLIIRGEGRAFSAGGDIRLFADHLDSPAPVINTLLNQLHDFLLALGRLPQPVITSVHGLAAGAGFSLAFMGDLCIAADDARFRPAYAALGVTPDGGGTVGVAGAVGPRRALQIFLGMEELSALDAHALGLVTQRVPAGTLEAETMALALRIAAMNPEVAAGTKRLIYQAARNPVGVQLEAEREQLLRCMTTPEFRAAVSRFVERSDR